MTPITSTPKLPRRLPDSHKGTYGRVLVVAGSAGMAGAAVLAGSAALRGGAGLVTVACPAAIQDVVAIGNPCYTTFGFRSSQEVLDRAAACDVLAVGPGLGTQPYTAELVLALVLQLPDKPIVLDADGLNNLAPIPDLRARSAPLVMTPHPGEFAKLLGTTTADVQANREPLAVEFAKTHNVILLLKGHRTLVTDGDRIYTNATGNPGMATGGCGDVLTGLIAALIGQNLSAFDASCLGAHVHGRAGDLAAAEVGQTALIASDLLSYLGKALQEVEA